MEEERRAKLEGDIRVLTQFLRNNHPLADTARSTQSKGDFQSALSSMATLLTYQKGHHTLCVLGDFRHPDDVKLVVFEESREDYNREMKQVTESGEMKKVTKTLSLAQVPSSGKTLEELAEINVPSVGDDLTQFSHAQDVVAALHGFRQEAIQDHSRVVPSRILLKRFFTRRCFSKLRVRVSSDAILFKKTSTQPKHFWEVLGLWINDEIAKRATGQPVEEQNTLVVHGSTPPIVAALARRGGMNPNSDLKWELNQSNIHQWASYLTSLLKMLMDRILPDDAETSPSKDDFSQIYTALAGLAWFERTKFLNAIGTKESFLDKSREHCRPRESLEFKLSLTSDDAKELANEKVEDVFFTYIKGITAWESAVSNLTNSKWLQSPGVTFEVRHLLSDIAEDRAMTNIRDLAKEIGISERTSTSIKPPKEFTGTIHCEALIMWLIHSVRSSTEDQFQDDFLKEFFERCSPCIGTSRKPCWMCTQLQTILFPDGKLQIEKSHGIVHAWNPPPNLSIPVLEDLRTRLVEKFEVAIDKRNLSKTQASSPATSVAPFEDFGSNDDDFIEQLAVRFS